MPRSFSASIATLIASVGAIMTATLICGLAVFMSGVLEVRAESPVKPAIEQAHAKSDRLPILLKGTACSTLGWPHYEQSCRFDLRRSADDVRTVRVVALR